MHLVGFIIRIYHDARSPERQILNVLRLDIFKAPRFTVFRAESHRMLTTVVGFNMNFMLFLLRIFLYSA